MRKRVIGTIQARREFRICGESAVQWMTKQSLSFMLIMRLTHPEVQGFYN